MTTGHKAALAGLALVAASALTPFARAQTSYPGLEPNDDKPTATPAFDLEAGDQLVVPAPCFAPPQLNFFRVRTAAAPPAIYRHKLVGVPTLQIWGRQALAGVGTRQVLPGSYAILQEAVSAPSGPLPFVSWYGFGRSEELFVNLWGTTTFCRFPLSAIATLESEVVAPIDLGQLPAATGGPNFVTISTGAFSVELFDANLRVLPLVAYPGDNRLAEGTYYLALRDGALATHLPPSPFVPAFGLYDATDFTDLILAESPDASFDPGLAVRDVISGMELSAPAGGALEPFEIAWYRFQIGTAETNVTFCAGDGTGAACPCGNDAPTGSGMGCLNATGRGATATAFLASTGERRVGFYDAPGNTAMLPFASLATPGAVPMFAGNLCLAPGGARLDVLMADAAGSAEARVSVFDVPGAMAGQMVYVQAAYRDVAAAAGCQVNLSSGVGFRL